MNFNLQEYELSDDEEEADYGNQMNALEEEKVHYVMSEKVIGDLKEFLRIMLGTIIRFYTPVVKFEELNEMKEDLIETTTSLIVNGKVYHIVFSFCQLETLDKQKKLIAKYKEFLHIRPEELGIDSFFTLNNASCIKEVRSTLIEKKHESAKEQRPQLFSINGTNELFPEQPNDFSSSAQRSSKHGRATVTSGDDS